MNTWQAIETAPKDGTEILCYREDYGIILARYTCPSEFLSENECERLNLGESADQSDWFAADFVQGERLDGDLVPTHWMPLPHEPTKRTKELEDGDVRTVSRLVFTPWPKFIKVKQRLYKTIHGCNDCFNSITPCSSDEYDYRWIDIDPVSK